jgi:uncharacterized protein
VCVEVDEVVDRFTWTSVVLGGIYEELPGVHDAARARARALKLLQERAEWWLPGIARLSSGSEHDTPVVYRIQIATMSGRRAARPSREPLP